MQKISLSRWKYHTPKISKKVIRCATVVNQLLRRPSFQFQNVVSVYVYFGIGRQRLYMGGPYQTWPVNQARPSERFRSSNLKGPDMESLLSTAQTD